jgi:hypothetical protein
MDTIILSRSATFWMADFAATSKAAEVDRMFRTTVLPTAFGPDAHPARVTAEIMRLNPGASVFIDE